jgi:hypothetical protein
MVQKITHLIERLSIQITAWLLFFKKEKQYGIKISRFKKFYSIRNGFLSGHPIKYNFVKYKQTDYISDIENIKMAYLNYPYGRLLRDKLVFSNYFNSYFKTPECYCIINKGQFQPVNLNHYINSFGALIELAKWKKLILKPLMGTAGIGINLLESNGGLDFLINKKPLNIAQIQDLINNMDNYLVVEYIEQSEFTKNIFPHTANTIRITTFCDTESPTSFIPYSFIRFGRGKSIPADNLAQGGIFSFIDIESGKLSAAMEEVDNEDVIIHTHHPDTGILIEGNIIPEWTSLKRFFTELGGIIKPYIKIVGWDIILTEDSFVVIEGNNGPDIYFQGANYPLAKNPEVLKFLKYFKIRK